MVDCPRSPFLNVRALARRSRTHVGTSRSTPPFAVAAGRSTAVTFAFLSSMLMARHRPTRATRPPCPTLFLRIRTEPHPVQAAFVRRRPDVQVVDSLELTATHWCPE